MINIVTPLVVYQVQGQGERYRVHRGGDEGGQQDPGGVQGDSGRAAGGQQEEVRNTSFLQILIMTSSSSRCETLMGLESDLERLQHEREVDRNKMKDLQASGVVQFFTPQELYFSMVDVLFLHV